MKTAYFLYKCRLCDTKFTNIDCDPELATKELIHVTKNIQSQVPILSTHLCNAPQIDKMGVADLIGYTVKE